MITKDQQLFCDSLIDELADKLDYDEDTIGHKQIEEIVNRRIENHDAELLATWKLNFKRDLSSFTERWEP